MDADVIDHPLDERIRLASADLRRQVDSRPVPAVVPARSTTPRTIAFAVAAVVVLVAGLVAIGNRSDRTDPTAPDPALPWIIPDLPSGWAPLTTLRPGPGADISAWAPTYTVFATPGAVDGPSFALSSGNDFTGPPAAANAFDYEDRTVNGVDVVVASGDRGTLAWARTEDGWRQASSSTLGRDELAIAVAHVIALADGTLDIPPAHLPAGVERLASGTIAELAPLAWGGLGYSPAPGVTAVVYSAGSLVPGLFVAESDAGVQLEAMAAILGAPEAVRVNSAEGWRFRILPMSAVYGDVVVWQLDGRLLAVGSSGDASLDLVALSASVRHASPDEWRAYPAAELPVAEAPAETEVPAEAPAVTETPVERPEQGTIREVPIPWSNQSTASHQVTLAATLPDGTTVETAVTLVAGGAVYRYGDEATWGSWADDTLRQFLQVGRGGGVLTRDQEATRLAIVVESGDRYLVDLVEVPDTGGTRAAMLPLPEGSPALVRLELLDADGEVIETYDLPT